MQPSSEYVFSFYLVLFVQLIQQPLVHHFVQLAVQLLTQLATQYFVQLAVHPEVHCMQERQGSGLTVVLLVQLCTHAVVQPASHMPALATDLPATVETTM